MQSHFLGAIEQRRLLTWRPTFGLCKIFMGHKMGISESDPIIRCCHDDNDWSMPSTELVCSLTEMICPYGRMMTSERALLPNITALVVCNGLFKIRTHSTPSQGAFSPSNQCKIAVHSARRINCRLGGGAGIIMRISVLLESYLHLTF